MLVGALVTDCWPRAGGAPEKDVVALLNFWVKRGMAAAAAPRVVVAVAENTDGNGDP